MSKSRSIPEELIKIKAHEIYKERQHKGKDGTPESDWIEAKKYLEKHRWEVPLWRLGKTLNKLSKSIGRVIKPLWKLLVFPFVLLWRFLIFPFWSFRTLHSLFADPQSRGFALDIVKTFISAFGLVATVFAGVGLYLNYQDGKEDRRLTQERLITDRFSKAVEQLGKEKDTTVRTGGIYALERIAKDSPKDFWTIMEVLTSYAREKSLITKELEDTIKKTQNLISSYEKREIDYIEFKRREQELIEPLKVSIDVQAVLTVIRRRKDPKPDRDERIDLRNTNLSSANLYRANLSSANLSSANLYRANLYRADLYRADLSSANLYRADLYRADLYRADLSSAYFYRAYLRSAYLSSANLSSTNLYRADLRNANLYRADLSSADLSRADLSHADLSSADLSSADLSGAYLNRANLYHTDLIYIKYLTPSQIKLTCYWEQATYKQDKEENKKYIEELKKDKSSDPDEPVDCSIWLGR